MYNMSSTNEKMQQPKLVHVQSLDRRTLTILKDVGVLSTDFNADKWLEDERIKVKSKYDADMIVYNEQQLNCYDELVLLAKNFCDEGELDLMLKSIEMYFKPHSHESFFTLKDGEDWNNGYKAHDGGNIYKSYEKRDQESYYSTEQFFSLAETFGDEWLSWKDQDLSQAIDLGKLWEKLGYEVFLVGYSYGRNYSLRVYKLSDYFNKRNWRHENRVYVKRK